MSDAADEVLSSEVYAAAFEAVMRGTEPGLLPEDQREAIRLARELTGTAAPGYPAPKGFGQ